MKRIHVLTAGFTSQNGVGFLMPLVLFKKALRDAGIAVRLFKAPSPALTDCDALLLDSKVFGSRWSGESDAVLDEIAGYRARVANLIYMDLFDSAAWPHARALPHVTLYCKSQVLKDRALYLRPLYGARAFTDYYHRELGVEDDPPLYSEPAPDRAALSKLAVSWHSGFADYSPAGPQRTALYRHVPLAPLLRFPHRLRAPSTERANDISLRVGLRYARPTIGYQRQRLAELLKGRVDTGRLAKRRYVQELCDSKIVHVAVRLRRSLLPRLRSLPVRRVAVQARHVRHRDLAGHLPRQRDDGCPSLGPERRRGKARRHPGALRPLRGDRPARAGRVSGALDRSERRGNCSHEHFAALVARGEQSVSPPAARQGERSRCLIRNSSSSARRNAAPPGFTRCCASTRDVFLPDIKEVQFFTRPEHNRFSSRDKGWDWYQSLYAEHPDKVTGDVTPDYIYWDYCAAAIADKLPDAKIIAILRDPIDRAYSQYWMSKRSREMADFEGYVNENRQLLGRGRYADQLQPYFERFPAENILVLFYEEVFADPDRSLAKVFEFLGVDPDFKSAGSGTRVGGSATYGGLVGKLVYKVISPIINHPLVQPVYRWLRYRTGLRDVFVRLFAQRTGYEPLAPATRQKLLAEVAPENRKLETLLGRAVPASWNR